MKQFPVSLSLILLILLAVPFSTVLAAQFRAGEVVTIPRGELLSDNTYLAGGEVTVSSSPLKDFVAAGGKLLLNAPVWGDALLAGGSIDILEPINGDLRAAGGQIAISQTVGGDAILAGGRVHVQPGTTVSGDAVIAGGEVVMDGVIQGTLRIYGGSVSINGTVTGPLYVRAGKTVMFGEKAVVKGNIIYTAPEEASVLEGAKLPTDVVFTQVKVADEETQKNVMKGVFAVFGVLFFVKFIAVLLASLLAASLLKTFSMKIASETLSRFWFMTLIGFLTVIVVPVAFIALLGTLVGMYLAFVLMALYCLALLGAGVYVNITTGALLAKLIKKEIRANWKWTLLGVIVVFIVALVPFIGWIAVALMYLASLGAIVMSLFRDAKAKM